MPTPAVSCNVAVDRVPSRNACVRVVANTMAITSGPHEGGLRVDVLFVAVGTRIWGTFAPDTRAVELGEEEPGKTEDLLNLAAIHTILNRGVVYAVPPAEMAGEALVAAVFRF